MTVGWSLFKDRSGQKSACVRLEEGAVGAPSLKVHKREKFFVSDFEFFTIL
jgi:hypothetical protein